jgi:1-acyl-sn-glycerol-3-phosphate acyltransferase
MIRVLDVDLRYIANHKYPLPDHFILVANHPSALEDFGVPALFDIYPLAKIEVRSWYVLGRISDYAGTIYVHRENADSRKAVIQVMHQALKAGKNLVIFPEGGCKGKDIYEEFKTGAFDLSIQAGVPILPVYLNYVDEETFAWHDQTLVSKLWQIFTNRNNRVEYHVYDALYPENCEDKYQFAEDTRQLFLQWQENHRAQSKTVADG